MPGKIEMIAIADLQNDVRTITKHYLKNLQGVDPYQTYKIGDVEFHSIYWLAAHLTWAEYGLIIRSISGKKSDIPWLRQFAVGSEFNNAVRPAEFAEVMEAFHQVHAEA